MRVSTRHTQDPMRSPLGGSELARTGVLHSALALTILLLSLSVVAGLGDDDTRSQSN